MKPPLRVYIGFDSREQDAFEVAEDSCRRTASAPVSITPIKIEANRRWGLIDRPWRVCRNSIWDVVSEAPQSTEFAVTRFLTPLLAQSGWAMFADSDTVFLRDVYEMAALADPSFALQCVKHGELPSSAPKMDGQPQTVYARKNWSSVMLFNCDHPAHLALTLETLRVRPGRDLHRFFWLQDEEIGDLPPEWNWLVDVVPAPANPGIAHFTLGVPSMVDSGSQHAEIWWAAWRKLNASHA